MGTRDQGLGTREALFAIGVFWQEAKLTNLDPSPQSPVPTPHYTK